MSKRQKGNKVRTKGVLLHIHLIARTSSAPGIHRYKDSELQQLLQIARGGGRCELYVAMSRLSNLFGSSGKGRTRGTPILHHPLGCIDLEHVFFGYLWV